MTTVIDEAGERVRGDAPAPPPAGRRPLWLILTPLLGLLAVSIAAGVSLGSVSIPIGDVWAIVAHRLVPGSFDPWWTDAREAIVIESRLPRALMAAAVGASLAVAGGVAQLSLIHI